MPASHEAFHDAGTSARASSTAKRIAQILKRFREALEQVYASYGLATDGQPALPGEAVGSIKMQFSPTGAISNAFIGLW